MMLEVAGLTHQYDDETAVEDVSFGVADGELLAVLGPSGCGKTTIVRAIAGHLQPTAGTVVLRDEDVTEALPETRRVSVVFQRSTLYPHMTVGENVAYGLKPRGFEADRRDELVAEYLELVSLAGQRGAYPAELSGGQRRRVELARALAPQPDVLVLDEPLSALDRSLRDRLRDTIGRIQRETGVTTLFVTHDQTDAMALADRLLVMQDGAIAGSGAPRGLYEHPPNPFVASFLGRSNALSGTLVGRTPPTVRIGDRTLRLDDVPTEGAVGSTVTCHVRPEHLSFRRQNDSSEQFLRGEIIQVRDLGRHYDVVVRLPSGTELVVEQSARPPRAGESVAVDVPAGKTTLFTTDGMASTRKPVPAETTERR